MCRSIGDTMVKGIGALLEANPGLLCFDSPVVKLTNWLWDFFQRSRVISHLPHSLIELLCIIVINYRHMCNYVMYLHILEAILCNVRLYTACFSAGTHVSDIKQCRYLCHVLDCLSLFPQSSSFRACKSLYDLQIELDTFLGLTIIQIQHAWPWKIKQHWHHFRLPRCHLNTWREVHWHFRWQESIHDLGGLDSTWSKRTVSLSMVNKRVRTLELVVSLMTSNHPWLGRTGYWQMFWICCWMCHLSQR